MRINKRTWAEVNLDAIAHNMTEIKRITPTNPKILAVVKADAYGHGFLEVSRTLVENGAHALAVAFADEAIQLKNAGIKCPIIILGYTPDEYAPFIVNEDIIPTVFSHSLAVALSNAAVASNKLAKIHIKIDTGMTRVGFRYVTTEESDNTLSEILSIASLPNVEIEGIFTHLSSADENNDSHSEKQFALFQDLIKKLESHALHIPIKHICNSAGLIKYPHMHMDMVRPGIILYGHGQDYLDNAGINLLPAMELKTIVSNIKWTEENRGVSYGKTYLTNKKTKICTLPIGYADGYSRAFSNKAYVLAGDKRVPIIGNICMDQCMIDCTNVNNINVGDEIILFGRKGNQNISVEELAKTANTINYEMLCVIGKRIPRVYLHDGRVVEILNYLLK